MDRRRHYLILGAIALAIGAFVTLYHGPGRPFLRGHVGDGAATMLVYALLGIAHPSGRMWVRGLLTFAIAAAIECGQLVWHAPAGVGAFMMGTQFDWIDLIMYAIGAAIGVGVDLSRRRRATPSSVP